LSASTMVSRIEDCSGVNSTQLYTESILGESMIGRPQDAQVTERSEGPNEALIHLKQLT